jgi:hypothetical protein
MMAGSLIFAILCLTTTQNKGQGPIYAQLVQSTDVMADIRPPPLYLAQGPHLTVIQAGDEKDAGKRKTYMEKLARLSEERG